MISVVVPAYNEQEVLQLMYDRLTACASSWGEEYEIVLVDDGSSDDTLPLAETIAATDPRLKIVALSRNFGHQAAVTAGLNFSRGDLIAVIDADLQDPPEELPRFFAKCREGFDVVYGIRTRRKESLWKRLAYKSFYRLLAVLANIEIPLDSGDFCVMSRRAVDAMNALPERNRFIRGLRSWVGFRQTGLSYERHARASGEPKYTISSLVKLALDGITNFSSRPLRLIAVLGLLVATLATAGGVMFLLQYLFDWTILGHNPRQARGWSSLIVAVLFLAGAQLFSLGILGEYIGRLFEEIKGRPIFLVGRTINVTAPDRTSGSSPRARMATTLD
jgi:polyisoprenyl-phosphate glycosyltransferase